ncbi:hypothetical protein EZS27_011272 [termite gut metagenome]|uniref:Uncharacterized protein n=1 Tax=termite gut metagenome TaxID=433724 RepID=A0A5J4S610_9ZZZZ
MIYSEEIRVSYYTSLKIYCFENIQVPIVEIPAGFTLQNINYVLKGLYLGCTSLKINPI